MTSAETLRPLLNSLLLSGDAALLTMIAATLAAYPLSRYSLRFKKPFMYSILFATGLPVVALMVPVYGLFVQLHLLDSLPGTILFLTATSLPIAIWLTKNFMDGVPLELEEAAWVDGASALRALRRVVLPLMLPGMSVVAIFTFIMAWGNFFVPFILLLSPSKQPAAVSIFQFLHGVWSRGLWSAGGLLDPLLRSRDRSVRFHVKKARRRLLLRGSRQGLTDCSRPVRGCDAVHYLSARHASLQEKSRARRLAVPGENRSCGMDL